MRADPLTMTRPDGTVIFVNRWYPEGDPVAVVQISHGMAEHSERYARFAEALTRAGYLVYANDHRGHGRTPTTPEDRAHLADHDGFATAVDDLLALTELIREENSARPALPLFLFGHSMGSFFARAYASRYGTGIDGLILSGTAGSPGVLGRLGALVAACEAKVLGRRHPSTLMTKLSFGAYNKAFAPSRTGFDWLSRDEAEVDAYVADEWCGETFTAGFYADLLPALQWINTDAAAATIPHDLPVHLVSGTKDPVGDNGTGVEAVAAQLRRAGITDVTVTLWPDGRHEMLNETNRDEVTDEILGWLENRRLRS